MQPRLCLRKYNSHLQKPDLRRRRRNRGFDDVVRMRMLRVLVADFQVRLSSHSVKEIKETRETNLENFRVTNGSPAP
jgi:hypothetical protein